MIYKCAIPKCKGNYTKGLKVSVFKFPNDATIRSKWIASIKRKDLIPTSCARVCELHFIETDIERMTHDYDERTEALITVPLPAPRLKSTAVPSIPPGCPSYLSASIAHREGPKAKRKKEKWIVCKV